MRYWLVMTILQFALMPEAMADAPIGRLFFTAEQRQHLERLRHAQHSSAIADAEANQVKSSVPTLPELTIQGYVERSGGKQIRRWVNGKPLQDDEIE
jgi:hypothetical protein